MAVEDASLSVCNQKFYYQRESYSEWFSCYGRFLILVNALV
jgi:hypothetical protein